MSSPLGRTPSPTDRTSLLNGPRQLEDPEEGQVDMSRPGSPTPSEIAAAELTDDEFVEYERGIISWRRAAKPAFWLRKEWAAAYVALVILIVGVTIFAFNHTRIVDWARPFLTGLGKVKAGFLIPIALIFVLSFPPLFGNEIIILLVGAVWGLHKGAGIVAAGVILGEGAVYFMFKHLCRARAERMTHSDLNYACLAEAIREGGFWMALVVRLSILPTHFTTAALAICGLESTQFLGALVLGLPKQLIAVYAGYVLVRHHASVSSKAITRIVLLLTIIFTILALRFIYRRMTAVRKKVLLARRRMLQKHAVEEPAISVRDYGAVDQSQPPPPQPQAPQSPRTPQRAHQQ